jgi:ELWxxDGT repeat protein
VQEINAGSGISDMNQPAVLGTCSYLIATNDTNGEELWKSDGKSAGTPVVKDIVNGRGDSFSKQLMVIVSRMTCI